MASSAVTPAAAFAGSADAPDPGAAPSNQEVKIDTAVEVGAEAVAPFLHSAQATGALAVATGLAPMFIHLGFLLAHLFQHHANTAPKPAAAAARAS